MKVRLAAAAATIAVVLSSAAPAFAGRRWSRFEGKPSPVHVHKVAKPKANKIGGASGKIRLPMIWMRWN